METVSKKTVSKSEQEPLLGPGISSEGIILARWGKTVKKIRLAQLESSWGTAQILGLDAFSWRLDWADLWAFRCIRDSTPSVRIATRGRREAVVAPSQFCLTVNDHGELVTIRAEDLQPGRSLVPLARRIPGPYPLKWPILQNLSLNPYGRRPKYTIRELPLTRNFGFFLGRYLANGSIENETAIAITNIHPALTEKIVAAAKQLGLKPRVSDSRIRISSTQLARIMEKEFGAGATKKRIPGWVFGASPAFRQGLVDGYWSHAWISECGMQMKLCSDSKDLAVNMQALLLSLGVQSSCREWYYRKKHGKNVLHYIVELAASSIGRMPLLTHPDRRACQRKWHIPEKDMLCVAPIPRELVTGRLRDKGVKGFGGFSFVNREASHPRHRRLLEGDLMWDVVECIEEYSTDAPLCQIQLVGGAMPVLYSGIVLLDNLCLDL